MSDRKSIAATPLIASIVTVLSATFVPIAAGWRWPQVVCSVIAAAILLVLAFRREQLGKLLGGPVERFLCEEHDGKTRTRCITAILLVCAGAIISLPLGAGQWGWAALSFGLGTLCYYWGLRVCPLLLPNRAAATVSLGGFMITLSANFIAGALAGGPSLKDSVAQISTILGLTQKIDETTQRIDATVRSGFEENKRRDKAMAKELNELKRLQSQINQTVPTVNPIGPVDIAKSIEDFRAAVEKTPPSSVLSHLQLTSVENTEIKHIKELERQLELPDTAASRARYAEIKNFLGNAWRDRTSGNADYNRNRAIACYEESLKDRSRNTAPFVWAVTQNNLSTALESRWMDCSQLRRSIACKKAALEVLTAERYPAWFDLISESLKDLRSRYEKQVNCSSGIGSVPFDEIAPAE